MSLFDIAARGGWIMLLIVFCSVLALAIFIERFVTLRKIRINARTFVLQIQNLLIRGRLDEAIKVCKQTPGPIAALTKVTLEKYNRPYEEIKEALESAGRTEIYHLEKYLGALATVAAVAPLLGFLGTVTGMIKAFMKIESLGGNVGPSVLAGGIWEALVTTAAGLIVGILAIIFYNYLQGKVSQYVYEMEESSYNLLEMVREKEVPQS
jgi:biopolymer transport protein ExbB